MFDSELSEVNLNTVSGTTSREDNTRRERLLVLRAILKGARDKEDAQQLRDMLGIKDEWLKEDEGQDQSVVRRRAIPRAPFQ